MLCRAVCVASTIVLMEKAHPLLEEVSQFVADQTAFPLGDISPETSLAHDIGMAGDDADEFFTAFIEKFGVDPDSLHAIDFEKHFGHEGWPFWFGCVVAIGVILALLIAGAFGLSIYLSGPLALPVVCLCLYLIWSGGLSKRRNDADDITVADLVRAAEEKKWLASPSA